jgi:hypothetical protein
MKAALSAFIPIAEGAWSSLYAAASPEVEKQSLGSVAVVFRPLLVWMLLFRADELSPTG